MPKNLKIGVVMGGPSSEHDISILTGRKVLQALKESGHDAHQVYVTHTGEWLYDNTQVSHDPADICAWHDVMFNAMHGEYGEDGRVQQIFEHCKVPYTGSGVMASAIAINKVLSRKRFQEAGLLVARGIHMRTDEFDPETHLPLVVQMAPPPWVIKPASRGSSVGVSIVKNYNDLDDALARAFAYDHMALVEEFVPGREVTCGVLEDYAGERHHALHPIEIIPPEGRFFDYEVKYNGETREIPAPFFGGMLSKIKHTAVAAHQALGCRHYSRTDMIVQGTKVYVLETNTLPGLTSESLLPKAAAMSRLNFPGLLNHIIGLAIERA